MQDLFEERIGLELCNASRQDNVDAAKDITTRNPPASWHDILAMAAAGGATQVATYCIEQGAEVDDGVLHRIICSDRSEPTYRFLVEAGHVGVDYDIEWSATMLGQMANLGRNSIVEYLLNRGGNPNCRVRSMLRKTALACAAGSRGDERTLDLLLKYGAKLNGSGALVFAAEKGRIANVKFLLANGADVDEMGVENPSDSRSLDKLGTALHKAVEAGRREVLEVLLAARADDQLKMLKGGPRRTLTRFGRRACCCLPGVCSKTSCIFPPKI